MRCSCKIPKSLFTIERNSTTTTQKSSFLGSTLLSMTTVFRKHLNEQGMLLWEAQTLLGGDETPSFIFIMLRWQAKIVEQYVLMNCITTSATSTHYMYMFYFIGNECSIFCLPQNSLEDHSPGIHQEKKWPYMRIEKPLHTFLYNKTQVTYQEVSEIKVVTGCKCIMPPESFPKS